MTIQATCARSGQAGRLLYGNYRGKNNYLDRDDGAVYCYVQRLVARGRALLASE